MGSNVPEEKNEGVCVLTTHSDQLPSDFFKKSHEIVFSQLSLSAREHDILALFLSRLQKDHWQSFLDGGGHIPAPVYSFESTVLCDWLNVKSSNLYNTLEFPIENLSGKKIGIKIKNKLKELIDFVPLFSRLRYEDGVLTVMPNSQLMNEFLGISSGHAQVNHNVFRALKSEHSKRLYAVISRFKDPAKGKLAPQSIDELRRIFGLLDEKGKLKKVSYGRMDNFLKRIIADPIKEISEKDDHISFAIGESGHYGFNAVKRSRKIIALEFLFTWEL